jgi:hypothetical protein
MTDRPRWWLTGVAALMAAIFLYQSVGWEGTAALCVSVLAAFAGYRWYRSRGPVKASGVRCLICGETLPATARQCKHCGSASWTVKN